MRILLIIILSLILIGCRTKKKVTERENVQIETVHKEDVTQKTETTTKIDSTVVEKEETLVIDKGQEIELVQADPEKTITIENEKGKKLVIKGADARIKQNDTKVLKNEESVLKTITEGNTSTSSDKTTSDKKDISKKSRTSDSYAKTAPTILVIGLVVVAIFFLYRYKNRLL